MQIRSFNDLDELSANAARNFADVATQAIQARGRFLVSLSGGSTPMKLYEQLVFENVNWQQVHFFWGDERCVPVNDAGNSYGLIKKDLFDKIDAPNVHRVRSELGPIEAAKDYAGTLKDFSGPAREYPRFDLVLLGMGDDGHTASLFPGSPVNVDTPTLAVTAHYQDRPANRVTLTPMVLNDAREIWFLVAGKSKAATLFNVLKGGCNLELYPAQRIQPVDGKLTWWIDKEAASLLEIP